MDRDVQQPGTLRVAAPTHQVSDEHLGFNVRYPVNDLSVKTGRNLKIPIRHYQIARVYGPGMAASCEEGLKEMVLDTILSLIRPTELSDS